MLEKLLQKNHLIISTILAKKIIFHIHIFTLSFIVVGHVQNRDQDLFARNHLNAIWRSLEVRQINTISLKPRPSGNLTFAAIGSWVSSPGSRERYLPLHTVLCAHFSPHCWILV
jgi:hypothetical protein